MMDENIYYQFQKWRLLQHSRQQQRRCSQFGKSHRQAVPRPCEKRLSKERLRKLRFSLLRVVEALTIWQKYSGCSYQKNCYLRLDFYLEMVKLIQEPALDIILNKPNEVNEKRNIEFFQTSKIIFW